MARIDGFGRSLCFAALAAAGLPVALTFVAPITGSATCVRLYLLTAAGLYATGLPPGRSRRLAVAFGATAAGGAIALLPLGLAGTAVGAAGIVAIARGVIARRQRPLRAALIEVGLGSAGLGVASFLASGGLLALCLAVWGYFLVQSAYFLLGGGAADRPDAHRDPFERARARLERLLDDGLREER